MSLTDREGGSVMLPPPPSVSVIESQSQQRSIFPIQLTGGSCLQLMGPIPPILLNHKATLDFNIGIMSKKIKNTYVSVHSNTFELSFNTFASNIFVSFKQCSISGAVINWPVWPPGSGSLLSKFQRYSGKTSYFMYLFFQWLQFTDPEHCFLERIKN
jgi:hypothetical protein